MSSRCRTSIFLLSLILGGAEAATDPAQKRAPLAPGLENPLPARPFVTLGTRRLQQERGVESVAFFPDGKTLAANETIWEAATGKALWDLERPPLEFAIDKVALSSDGKLVAGRCWRQVLLWETAKRKIVRVLAFPEEGMGAVLFSPDNKYLATTHAQGQKSPIRLWEVASGRLARRFDDSDSAADTMVFSTDGKKLIALISGNTDLKKDEKSTPTAIVGWDVASGKQVFSWPKIRPKALSTGGKLCTLVGEEGRIQIYDLERRRLLRSLQTRDAENVFSPDGTMLATMGKQNLIRLWDVATGRLVKELRGRKESGRHSMKYLLFGFSPDGKLLASASRDDDLGSSLGRVSLWDVAKGEELLPAEDHYAAVTCLAFSADGKTLVSGGVDRTLHLWDTVNRRHSRRFTGHEDAIDAVAVSPSGRCLASFGRDKTLRLWDAKGGELHCLDAPANPPLSLTFLEDGKILQWWGWIGAIRHYEVASGTVVGTRPSRRGYFHSSPLGTDGLSAPWEFAAHENADWPPDLLPFSSGKKPLRKDAALAARYGNPRHLRVSSDGRMAAAVETISWGGLAGDQCRIRVWELATGGLIADLGQTSGTACLLAFSRNGWGLFSSGEGLFPFWAAAIQGWDVNAGKPVYRFQAPLTELRCPTVSPQGTKLAAGGKNGLIYIWDTDKLFEPPAAPPLAREDLDRLTAHLDGDDAAAAYRAMYRLARCPEQSVPFLHQRLRRRTPTTTRFRQLIADLDADEFALRARASRELERMGSNIESALRRAQEKPPSLEVRLRIKVLLEKLGDDRQRKRLALETLRAVSVLERIGTAKARAALRDLVKTSPDSDVGLEADAALRRLEPQPLR
jgi:WD40 repeat protein